MNRDQGWRRREFIKAAGFSVAALVLDDRAIAASPDEVASAPGTTARTITTPWWDDWPTFVQVEDAGLAKRLNATACLCGAADDSCWGLWGQRLRVAESGKRETDALHAFGVKALTWVEGFGNPSCYVVQLKKDPDGSWVKLPGTDVTRVFHNHWNWAGFDGTGEVRWVGIHTYWGDADYARPFTYRHPRYGAPPATYPDGRLATGYAGNPNDPRNSRVYDAVCSKSILGNLWGADAGRQLVTDLLSGATPRPDAGDAARNTPAIVPDPGYTPAQWAEHIRTSGALTVFGTDKDSACPIWADYARAEARMALDCGVDGMWVDNFSPWDSFNASPIDHAFGEWSVARFRAHLRARFAPQALGRMGVADPDKFDVREYLKRRLRDWGGEPGNLKDARWADVRWQEDPIWRAYLIHRRICGTEALSRLYRAIKEEAAKAGKPDFLVMGNDIPAFSLGWPRGDLDMVSTELTWGWWLGTGPRGIMPPPLGCYVPVYKLAREHARSRFVNTWPYAAAEAKGKPNIARVIHGQGLATHTLPMPETTDQTLGTQETTAAFNHFVRSVAPVFDARVPIEEVGLYYSSSSQLMEMLPGGYRDHADQVHMFSFWGWGTALTWLHTPWRAVPEWKLTSDVLKTLRLLILPNTEVFPAQDLAVLHRWVRAGGRLILAGNCGRRSGEADNFERCRSGSTLEAPFREGAAEQGRALGKGRVLVRSADPGLAFYQADKLRPGMLSGFATALGEVGVRPEALSLDAPEASWKVGLTAYRSPGRLFVDVNNTDIDLSKDQVTPAAPLRFRVALPRELRSAELAVRVFAFDQDPPAATVERIQPGRAAISLGQVRFYASVMLFDRRATSARG